MIWTSDPPTKPGYYWCKHHDIERHAEDAGDMDIGYVEFFEREGTVCLIGDDVIYSLNKIDLWSDEPIEEPVGYAVTRSIAPGLDWIIGKARGH